MLSYSNYKSYILCTGLLKIYAAYWFCTDALYLKIMTRHNNINKMYEISRFKLVKYTLTSTRSKIRVAQWYLLIIIHCCLGSSKGIWPVKKLSGGMLAWLYVWGKVQICL